VGLLSGLVNVAKTVVKKIISNPFPFPGPGGPLPSPVPWPNPGGTLKKVLDMIFGSGKKNDELAEDTGNTDSYDMNNAELNETIHINKILDEYKRRIEDKIDLLEESCINESQEYFNYLIDEMDKMEEKYNIKINTRRFKRYIKDIEKEIRGSSKRHISRRVSLADNECREILAMSKGERKKSRMKEFAKEVIKETLFELSDSIKVITEEQQDYLDDIFNDKIDEIIKNNKKKLSEVEEIEELIDSNRKDYEMKKSEINLTIDICQLAVKEIKL